MKLKIVFENFDATVEKLKKSGINALSQSEKDEIDAAYHEWLKVNKSHHDNPIKFLKYLKTVLKLD